MRGHLRRCRSALRAHVRPSTLRAQGSPSAWHLATHEQAPNGLTQGPAPSNTGPL
jgi:hypothetical protein